MDNSARIRDAKQKMLTAMLELNALWSDIDGAESDDSEFNFSYPFDVDFEAMIKLTADWRDNKKA